MLVCQDIALHDLRCTKRCNVGKRPTNACHRRGLESVTPNSGRAKMPDIQKDQSGGGKKLPSHAKVVVIGGRVVGCSILFHLAKFG